MRTIFLTLLISAALFQDCKGQNEIFNEDFNWTITVPEDFVSVPADQWAQMQNKSVEAFEKSMDTDVKNTPKTIFVFRSDLYNYFESNYLPFNSEKDGDYLEYLGVLKNLLYTTLKTQIPKGKLDTTSYQETIGGKRFYAFKTSVQMPNELVLEFLTYRRLFAGRELTVNISTIDKEKQKVLLDAWRGSKFGAR